MCMYVCMYEMSMHLMHACEYLIRSLGNCRSQAYRAFVRVTRWVIIRVTASEVPIIILGLCISVSTAWFSWNSDFLASMLSYGLHSMERTSRAWVGHTWNPSTRKVRQEVQKFRGILHLPGSLMSAGATWDPVSKWREFCSYILVLLCRDVCPGVCFRTPMT